jgi:hypothetical protein
LYELRSATAIENKRNLLIEVAKWSGGALAVFFISDFYLHRFLRWTEDYLLENAHDVTGVKPKLVLYRLQAMSADIHVLVLLSGFEFAHYSGGIRQW